MVLDAKCVHVIFVIICVLKQSGYSVDHVGKVFVESVT